MSSRRAVLTRPTVTSFLEFPSFKYESIHEVSQLAKLRDLVFSVDLKSGYHHIDVAPDHWQFLGFEWQGHFYVFCQIPFGLATACFVFTKVMKQLVQHWRKLGIRLIPYIDDFMFIRSSLSEFTAVQSRVLSDFAQAGFVVAKEKCQLQPSHTIQFLGFVVDTLHGLFHLTAARKRKLQEAISACLASCAKVPAKLLARTTGLITSCSLVTGPLSGLFSHFLHRALNTRSSWRATISLDPAALGELQFWQSSLEQFSSKEIWPQHSLLRVLHYDAGADGWGGHLIVDGQEHKAHGFWAPHERHGQRSSTWRELEGLFRFLSSVHHLLSGFTVLARGDALNVFFLLYRSGSKAEHLQEICLRLFWFCREHQIKLLPEWIPRERNQLADYLSKVHETDDFGLQPEMFRFLLSEFGPLDVDRFASEHNALLPVFFSEFWCPGSAGVNAFTVSWHGSSSYCFPPPRLVFCTLLHARESRARIVLVVPAWKGQPWWPLLVQHGGSDWSPLVRRCRRLPAGPRSLRPGRSPKDSFLGGVIRTATSLFSRSTKFSSGE
jgi:hypothetical protein